MGKGDGPCVWCLGELPDQKMHKTRMWPYSHHIKACDVAHGPWNLDGIFISICHESVMMSR
jgi:hypothetical protein